MCDFFFILVRPGWRCLVAYWRSLRWNGVYLSGISTAVGRGWGTYHLKLPTSLNLLYITHYHVEYCMHAYRYNLLFTSFTGLRLRITNIGLRGRGGGAKWSAAPFEFLKLSFSDRSNKYHSGKTTWFSGKHDGENIQARNIRPRTKLAPYAYDDRSTPIDSSSSFDLSVLIYTVCRFVALFSAQNHADHHELLLYVDEGKTMDRDRSHVWCKLPWRTRKTLLLIPL